MESDLVFDVGLHLGEDTEYYLKKGYRVVAFEADPDLVSLCRARFQREMLAGRLTLISGAVESAEKGAEVPFYRNDLTVWGTTQEAWARRNAKLGHPAERITVPRIDFRAVLRQHGMPFYLKLDIEGADSVVLNELLDFWERPPFLSIESDKTSYAKLVAEFDMLERLGYNRFKRVQQRCIPGRRIRTRSLDGRTIEHVFAEHASGPFAEDLAGKWASRTTCLRQYRRAFYLYRALGDNPPVFMRPLKNLLGWCGYHVGWYDTHAAR